MTFASASRRSSKVGLIFLLALVGIVGVRLSAATEPQPCEKLRALKLPNTRITGAELVTPAPRWQVPDSLFTRLPGMGPITVSAPFCRVQATLEKEIRVEVWLPLEWNERFQGVGNGGFAGALNYAQMAQAVAGKYATASTDTGHVTEQDVFQDDWIAGHPNRVVDFAYRAHHLMAERSKDIIAAFYGKRAVKNYYNGCSSGGWQGLTEAQRYPSDYDGILAGAPANNYVGIDARAMRMRQLAEKEPQGNLDVAASNLLVRAAVAKCDMQDGLRDDLISEPLKCTFDPRELQCKAGQTDGCLNAAQVRRAQATYGPSKSANGLKQYPGPAWGAAAYFTLLPPTQTSQSGPGNGSLAKLLQTMQGQKPKWTPLTFNPDTDLATVERQLGPTLNSDNPDLKAFQEHGGKLILYHGWIDSGISPYNTLGYVDEVTHTLGASRVEKFVRTFMAPGMEHCSGGTGPSLFDAMPSLVAWVERGEPPRQIIAAQPGADGSIVRTRPLCPFPQVARYKGTGRVEAAESFECKTPE